MKLFEMTKNEFSQRWNPTDPFVAQMEVSNLWFLEKMFLRCLKARKSKTSEMTEKGFSQK